MNVQGFLARLQRVKRQGKGWIASCPAHGDDTHPSLSVTEGADGRILVHCFAACPSERILESLGLDASALFPDRDVPSSLKREIVATYDYRDESGVVLYQSVRYSPKSFSQRRPDGAGGWIANLQGVRRVLYRLPELRGQPAIVVCYSPDTEILTDRGWMLISGLIGQEQVAQYIPESGNIEFVRPLALHALPFAGDLCHIKTMWCDLLVTPDHRMLRSRIRCHPRVIRADELVSGMALPTAGKYLGGGQHLLDHEVRLLVAFAADGCVASRGTRISWGLKKQRKQRRLRSLLEQSHIPYHERPAARGDGEINFWIDRRDGDVLLHHMPLKQWHCGMLNWSHRARTVALEELPHWDGTAYGARSIKFETAREGEAAAVAAVAAITGYSCIVTPEDRPRRQRIYHLALIKKSHRQIGSTRGKPPWKSGRVPYEGLVYCVTVPSGFVVVRRNGRTTIAGNCEGERDVVRAWNAGIPATCNAMGAGKWDESYTAQLKAAGVLRVAVIADRDAPGLAHARTVAASCHRAGLQVRLIDALPDVPEHGDLSDYLETRTKADLIALLRQTPVFDPRALPTVEAGPDKLFTILGETRYRFTMASAGITMDLDHVHREKADLKGELVVRVNGFFAEAQTYRDGILSMGELNLSAVRSRKERANLLREQARNKEFDWYPVLEEFAVEVLLHEKRGPMPLPLGLEDVLGDEDEMRTWEVEGLPLLMDDPMVLYGDSASGKSYLSLWLAGMLAQRGLTVLYADWEYSKREHDRRIRRLFQPVPKGIDYTRCDIPLRYDADRLARLVADRGYHYLIADSIGFAVDGPAETHEAARSYFAGLRQVGVGSLSLAHIAKHQQDGKDPTVFGSTFFRAGARSAWFVDRASEHAKGELNIGLYHRKSNASDLLKPLGFQFSFTSARVHVTRIDPTAIASLASHLSLTDRLKRHMTDGEFYAYTDLAQDMDVKADSIRRAVMRSGAFDRVGRKVRLKVSESDHVAPSRGVHHEF